MGSGLRLRHYIYPMSRCHELGSHVFGEVRHNENRDGFCNQKKHKWGAQTELAVTGKNGFEKENGKLDYFRVRDDGDGEAGERKSKNWEN